MNHYKDFTMSLCRIIQSQITRHTRIKTRFQVRRELIELIELIALNHIYKVKLFINNMLAFNNIK
jgi:cell division protein FtsB